MQRVSIAGWTQAIPRKRYNSWERDYTGQSVPYVFLLVIGQPDTTPAVSNEVVSEVFRGRVDKSETASPSSHCSPRRRHAYRAWPERNLAKDPSGRVIFSN